jgi:hypothetical protein
MTQLDPPIPVHVMGRGDGMAQLVIDYGPDYDLCWIVFMDDDGQCWAVRNPGIRGRWNETMGRMPQ